VTDVTIQPAGLLVAALSVVSSGMQQILCGSIQRQHKLQSHQLLANTAPMQGCMLLVLGPFIDRLVSGSWVGRYTLTTPGLACLLASCAISVVVNISQFMCLGRFSAVTFQVRGASTSSGRSCSSDVGASAAVGQDTS
jgi:solute carrier family 35 protein E3